MKSIPARRKPSKLHRRELAKPVKTVFDMFASELPDSYFEGLFDERSNELPHNVAPSLSAQDPGETNVPVLNPFGES